MLPETKNDKVETLIWEEQPGATGSASETDLCALSRRSSIHIGVIS